MDIAILGCGPAGLLTALAVEERGFNPVIYSIAKKSIMPGAQFLHEYIDGASQPEDHLSIDFRKKGTKEGYATKVYGSPDASCSWDDFPSGAVEAWSLAGAYDRLWARYGDQVIDVEITERLLDGIEQRFALAFSTVPAPVLDRKSVV